MSARPVQFWFEFASTYSYPAAMRIERVAADAGVSVVWRPFLLGPIFADQGWRDSPFNIYPAKGRYMWRDLERLCADLDVPFRRPDPFPQNSLLAARVALVALDQGRGEAFCVALFRAQFGDGRRIDDVGVLDDVLATLQIDPSPVLAAARSDANKTRLRAQTEEAQRLGLFGAPSFTTEDGELFWGNDRLEAALRWAGGQRIESSE
jgi:2-hydroxychromene-2-carboxylate isomerase